MTRFLKYLVVLFFSAKLAQGVRSAFGANGLVPQLVAAVHISIQNKVRSAAFVITGFTLLLIGSLYLLFHCAAEWDNLGYFTFNAQKTVSVVLMVIGIALIYPARAVLRRPPSIFEQDVAESKNEVDPAHQLPLPPNPNVQKIQKFFSLINAEATQFLDQATRPKNSNPRSR